MSRGREAGSFRRDARNTGGQGGATPADPLFSLFPTGIRANWRSDSGVTLGAGVASWTDRYAGRVLLQATGTKQPAFNLFQINARPTLTFDGTSDELVSNEAASAWRFLSDGTGCTVFCVLIPRTDPYGTYLATNSESGSTPGIWLRCQGGAHRCEVYNTTSILSLNSATTPNDVPVIVDFSYKEVSAPEGVNRTVNTQRTTGNSTGAPTAGDPNHTLILGAIRSGGFYSRVDIAELIVFNRELSAAEKSTVYTSYLQPLYGSI